MPYLPVILGYGDTAYIDEGNFGRTFKAVDEHRLNTICVIKEFLAHQQNSDKAIISALLVGIIV